MAVDQSEVCSVFLQCAVSESVVPWIRKHRSTSSNVEHTARSCGCVISVMGDDDGRRARLCSNSLFLSTPDVKRCSLTLSLFMSLVLLSLVTHRFYNQQLESNL